jgi:asparagine synthetase B (glutamine-hydrolysing)
MAFDLSGTSVKLDSIFDWKQDVSYKDINEASEEFERVFRCVIKDMTPAEPYALGFSGGIDTSCILAMLPDTDHLYTLNNIGKDTVSTEVTKFLNDNQQARLITIDIDEQQWAEFFKQTIAGTCMPAQSWSFVGQWIISSRCQERILFSGIGADELFGGYPIYSTLNYTELHSTSPYSYFTDNAEMQQLWNQCMNFYSEPQSATLLMDYLIQISSVDMRGVDSCTQAFGIEPRSPFTHPAIIKFALNLPYEYRQGKPLLKRLFLKHWNKDLLLPKQGFTGHCNDSYPYLNIDIARDPDRYQDWRNILQASFVNICRPVD